MLEPPPQGTRARLVPEQDTLAKTLARAVDERVVTHHYNQQTSRPVLARGHGGSKTKNDESGAKDSAPGVGRWLEGHRSELQPMCAFYVRDHVQFASVRAISAEEMEKRRPGESVKMGGDPEGRACNTANTAYADGCSLNHLKIVKDAMYKAKAGICTTFAFGAAYVLMQDMTAPRIEIVAFNGTSEAGAYTHLFVLVGRPRGTELADYKSWRKETWVVDTWAGALGYGCIIRASDYRTSPIATHAARLAIVWGSD